MDEIACIPSLSAEDRMSVAFHLAASYRSLVCHARQQDHDLKPFQRLLEARNQMDDGDDRTITSVLEFGKDEEQGRMHKQTDLRGLRGLEEYLDQDAGSQQKSKLFVVENIGPSVATLLGATFAIDPQMFADHFENAPWYRLLDVKDHLPSLPSVHRASDYVRFGCFATRTFTPTTPVEAFVKDILPTRESMYIRRKGSLNQQSMRLGVTGDLSDVPVSFEPVLFTRQFVTVWFSKYAKDRGWRGVILLDPPFVPDPRDGYIHPPEYRAFQNFREATDHHPPPCLREAFVRCLQANQGVSHSSTDHPLAVTAALFRIIASEWIVTNAYMERELVTVEWNLEHASSSTDDLELFLRKLFMWRRRVSLYSDLVNEQSHFLSRGGRACWSSDEPDSVLDALKESLQLDFSLPLRLLDKNCDRVEKNMQLVTALIAVGENKIAISKGRSIRLLTIVGTIFIPFGTVATILGMDSTYLLGAASSWIFWVVSVVLTVLVLLLYVYYGGE